MEVETLMLLLLKMDRLRMRLGWELLGYPKLIVY